jgi:hypothetical protein
MFLWIESCLAALSIAVGCTVPNLGRSWLERAEQLCNFPAQRPGLSVAGVGLTALAARAAAPGSTTYGLILVGPYGTSVPAFVGPPAGGAV